MILLAYLRGLFGATQSAEILTFKKICRGYKRATPFISQKSNKFIKEGE